MKSFKLKSVISFGLLSISIFTCAADEKVTDHLHASLKRCNSLEGTASLSNERRNPIGKNKTEKKLVESVCYDLACKKDENVLFIDTNVCKKVTTITTESDINIGEDINIGSDLQVGKPYYVQFNGQRYRCKANSDVQDCLKSYEIVFTHKENDFSGCTMHPQRKSINCPDGEFVKTKSRDESSRNIQDKTPNSYKTNIPQKIKTKATEQG